MALDLLALVLLAIFAALGARRGALATGLSLAGFVVGYAVAIYAGRLFGDVTAEAFGVSPILGSPIAGTLAFCFVSFDFFVLSWVLRRRGDGTVSPASRIGGALFGLARGSVAVVLVGLLALWVDAMPQLASREPSDEPIPDTPVRALTRAVVQAGVESALVTRPARTSPPASSPSPEPRSSSFERSWHSPRSALSPRTASSGPTSRPTPCRPPWISRASSACNGTPSCDESWRRWAWSTRSPPATPPSSRSRCAACSRSWARASISSAAIRSSRSSPATPPWSNSSERRDVVGLLSNPAVQQVLGKAIAAPST